MTQTGRLLERVCMLCAALFSCVVLLQNIRSVLSGQPAVTLAALLGWAAVLLLCLRFLRPGRWFLPGLFLLRFILALAVILLVRSQPVQDFDTMYQAACQLSQGDHSYLSDPYFYNWAYQSAFVAYESIVIRLFGQGLLPLQLLNAVYMGLTACAVHGIARRFLAPSTAAAVSVLYAVYPAPLFLAGVLTNQHLATLLFYTAIYLILSGSRVGLLRAAGAGALTALGNAIRPIGVILILAILLAGVIRFLFQREDWRTLGRLAACAVSYALVFAALSALIVSSGVNPSGLSNNLPMWKFVLGFNQESSGAWNQADYDAYYTLPNPQAREAMAQAVHDRLSVGADKLAGLAVRKSALMWAGNEDLFWGFGHLDQNAGVGPLSVNTILLLLGYWDKGLYVLIFALAALGALRCLFRGCSSHTPRLLLILFCGYYAVHLLVEVQSRYRYFIMPAVFLAAGVGIELLCRHPLRLRRT